MKLKEAVRILLEQEHLEDWAYNIRDRAREDGTWDGNSWDHPRVRRFAEICKVLRAYIND